MIWERCMASVTPFVDCFFFNLADVATFAPGYEVLSHLSRRHDFREHSRYKHGSGRNNCWALPNFVGTRIITSEICERTEKGHGGYYAVMFPAGIWDSSALVEYGLFIFDTGVLNHNWSKTAPWSANFSSFIFGTGVLDRKRSIITPPWRANFSCLIFVT